MALAREVARILRDAGAPLATASEAGVILRAREAGAVEARWSAPRGPDPRYDPLLELEWCAATLREAGIRATLVMEDAGPWVLCPAPGAR